MLKWWVIGGIVALAAFEYFTFWSDEKVESTWVCPECLRSNAVSQTSCLLCEKPRPVATSKGAP